MKKTHVPLFAAFLALFIVLWSCGGQATRDNKWKLTVVSASYERGFQHDNFGPADGVLVVLKIKYLGSEEKTAVPLLRLKNGKGEEIMASHLFGSVFGSSAPSEIIAAAAIGNPDEITINEEWREHLEKSEFKLFFNMSEKDSECQLLFGDLPPVQVEL